MVVISARTGSPLSFPVTKAVLAHLNLPAFEESELPVARALRVLAPLDASLADLVRGGETSLTDSATPDEQIRFFQERRLNRQYARIAQWVRDTVGTVSVKVTDAKWLTSTDRDFLASAVHSAGWEVEMTFESDASAVATAPGEREGEIVGLLAESQPGSADVLIDAAFEYVNVGDAQSAATIGMHVLTLEQSPRVWNLLALSHAMLDRTVEAERYYAFWRMSDKPLDKVRALYGQSMLYARHHPAGLRDLDRSAQFLDTAYALIQDLDPETRAGEDVRFDEVFNRNGYALVLFRRGQVDEAIDLLEWGIGSLAQTGPKVSIHRTVLIYNLAQCFKQLGRIDEAVATYQRLLAVDPFMAEYHLEAAKCYALGGNLPQAVECCRDAIEIDPTLAVAWSLLGLYLSQNGDRSDAADAYLEAHRNDAGALKPLLDAAHCYLLAGDLEHAGDVLRSATPEPGEPNLYERFALLNAELCVRHGDRSNARDWIDRGLALVPGSTSLRENRDLLAVGA